MAKTATVVRVDTNAMQGNYPVTRLTLNDGSKDKDHSIFKKSPLINVVNGLQPGDTVEYGMVQQGKYWNLDSIKKVDAPLFPPQSSSFTGNGGGTFGGNKDVDIRRAVALKASIDLYSSLLKNTKEINLDDIMGTAAVLEKKYLEAGYDYEEKVAESLND